MTLKVVGHVFIVLLVSSGYYNKIWGDPANYQPIKHYHVNQVCQDKKRIDI